MRRVLMHVATALLWLFCGFGFCIAINRGIRLMNMDSDLAVLGGLTLIVAISSLMFIVVKDKIKASLMLVVCCSVLLSGCYRIIPPGHVGIKVEQTGSDRGVSQIPVSTGRVFYNPVNETVLDYPTFVQRAIWTASSTEGKRQADGSQPNEEISFQSSDSLHFTGDVAVAYQLQKDRVPAFYVQFRSDDLDVFTHGFFRDAVRKSIGIAAQHYSQEEINGGKQADLEAEAQRTLTIAMAPYGVQIVQLAFTSPPRPPEQVKQAIQAKVAAIQRAEQIENEKRQAIAEGAKTVALAEAQAQANAVITKSITPQLLQWEQMKIMQTRWDGKMPMVTGNSNPLMLALPKQ